MLFDYLTLKIIWWVFVGVLLIGFALMGGFDLGIGTLLPFVARTDTQRRVMINAIGPTWEGNQVWLITAGGALFAAWPLVYAAAFSGFYWAMLLVLFALFFRPVGFKYRSLVEDTRWRNAWDWGLFAGGLVPALVFGVAFGNLLQGVPFHYGELERLSYTGSFWGLLNPFALLAGIVSVCMLVMHGAVFLQIRTENEINARAKKAVRIFGIAFMAAFGLAGIWQAYGIEFYQIVSMPDPETAFSPLAKKVEMAAGGLMQNYATCGYTIIAPILAFAGAILAIVLSGTNRPGAAFVCSGAALAGVILTAGFAMFPFIIPSSTDPNSSLTVYDAVSSHRTLNLMFMAVVIFLPIVLVYTSWVYRVMRGKVTEDRIKKETHTAY
ncbi:cytochrome d ubiquinol oxidase subunit 2 [Alkalispirochaeta odontotermitis]|nr:cytochrome d ubiquinol oxidase subunit 2 [Alkalispirochaeta odontotermitis]CAB1077646.1 Cytochrome d ubiquinol oxidase subunit II (EC [Olavius algarvensis Delta 1 endosymbiont]